MIEANTPVTVTVQDLRALTYCGPGIAEFCARHEINFREFLKHGVVSTILDHIDDDMVRAAVVQARKRVETETP